MPPPPLSCSLSRPTRPLCSVWALEVVSRGLCPVHWSWKKSVLCLVMEQDISGSREWWEVVRVHGASRERDRPLEATSSEEVKAAFVWLLSAACLVIIPSICEHRPRVIQGRSIPKRPTEDCTTHRQQRLSSHRAMRRLMEWDRTYIRLSVVRRVRDEGICTFSLLLLLTPVELT